MMTLSPSTLIHSRYLKEKHGVTEAGTVTATSRDGRGEAKNEKGQFSVKSALGPSIKTRSHLI